MVIDHFILSARVTFFTTAALGIFVLLNGRWRIRHYAIFSFYCFAISFWCLFVSLFNSTFEDPGLVYGRTLHVFAVFIPISFFLFIESFLQKNFAVKKLLFVIVAGLLAADLFSNFLITGVTHHPQYSFPTPGVLYPLFVVYFALVTLAGIVVLFLEYRKTTGRKRDQLKYLLFFSIIGYIGGTKNFLILFDWHLFPIYPYGTYAIPLYVLGLCYAIIKYRLMDIKVAFTRAGVFITVYTLVLGIPVWVGFRTMGSGMWLLPVTLMAALATVGPFVYIFIQRRAEERLLAEQRKYQATLRQASAGMGRIRDLKKLLNLIVAILTRVVRIEHVCVYFFDADAGAYRLSAMRRMNAGEPLRQDVPVMNPVVKELSVLEAPLIYEEIRQKLEREKDPGLTDIEAAMKELKAEIAFPVFIRSKLMAIVILGRKLNSRVYSEDDLVVFSILANQASLAIENALSYEDMKKTQEQLFRADKMATIGTMADGLSHQINNRLHAMGFIVSDMLDTLKMRRPLFGSSELKAVADEFEYSLARVQENVSRGGEIVQGLMKYTRKGEEGFAGCSIDLILDTAYEMAQFKIRSTEFKVTKEYDPAAIPKVRGNFTQLQEVFFNLIDNAYDATLQRKAELKEEGYAASLKVSITDVDGWVEIVFSDNGMGVKPGDKDKLFTPFFTTKATSKKGTGLGLYVIRKIIEENHGGKVEMRSVYGQGTEMVLRLAVSREA